MLKLLLAFALIGFISAIDFKQFQRRNGQEDFGKWIPYLLEGSKSSGSDVMNSGTSEEGSKSSSVSAAIKTQRYHRVIPVDDEEEEVGTHVIKIDPYRQPVSIVYKTESNPVTVEQIHKKAEGKTEESESEDEPHRVIHKVFRPIIQEVKEIIQPYRRIRQEVRPVLEEVHTVVARRDRSKESEKKKEQEQNNESAKRPMKLKMRAPLMLEEDSSSDDDDSNKWKVKYMSDWDSSNRKMSSSEEDSKPEDDYNQWKPKSENDSSNRKLKDIKRTTRYTDDITSVLEQMNNLMAGEMKMIGSEPSMMTANPSLLNLNSGNIKLWARDANPIYSGNLDFVQDYL